MKFQNLFSGKNKKNVLKCLLNFLPRMHNGIQSRAPENNSIQGPVVQSVVSLTSSLRVISLTVLADSIHNILIFFAEKM